MAETEQKISIKRDTDTSTQKVNVSPKVEIPNAVRAALNNSHISTEKVKYPSEPIGLPSEGYFYDEANPLSSGTVDIKYMTAREEDILTSQNLLRKGVVLERLLEALIITPGVKLNDILIGDKNALFVAARRLAYGDSYGPVEITCRACAEENKKTIDLSTIKNKEFDFSKYTRGQNNFEYVLPHSNRKVTYKILTHKDEAEIDKELEGLNKMIKTGISPEITTRLKKVITSLDGNSDKAVINKFVDVELTARDSIVFRQYIKDNSPNVDMGFEFICDSCNHKELREIPLTVQFFWPNSRL